MPIKKNPISDAELELLLERQSTPKNQGKHISYEKFLQAFKELCSDKETFIEILRQTPTGYQP